MNLRHLQAIGLLDGLDVRFARALGRLGRTDDDRVLLAAALANRAPRVGDVGIELRAAHALSTDEHPLDPRVEGSAMSPIVGGPTSAMTPASRSTARTSRSAMACGCIPMWS